MAWTPPLRGDFGHLTSSCGESFPACRVEGWPAGLLRIAKASCGGARGSLVQMAGQEACYPFLLTLQGFPALDSMSGLIKETDCYFSWSDGDLA